MELTKISDYEWEIPKSEKMQVSARVFASKALLDKMKTDQSLQQLRNMACLKGIQKHAFAMPDAHMGYGFCIGGVAAFDMDEGIVSPGGVGYDINCGVRLLRTDFTFKEIAGKRRELLEELYRNVPPGAGRKGTTGIDKKDLLEVLDKGAQWALKNGYASKDDLDRTEEYGRMKGSDPGALSKEALERGLPQIGTLGSGNHFLELQRVEKIFDTATAKKFGMEKKDQVVIMIHCGSRGLGHQVASDYIQRMEKKVGSAKLPDRELICAPIQSEIGQEYMRAMAAAINFAFCNRQLIAHRVRESFRKILGTDEGIAQVYDVCHNIAKVEKHMVDGHVCSLCVHRKGATRSFGPGRSEIPEVYRSVGQPVLIPGSMGTSSYVIVGTKRAEDISFGSTAHGAGRAMSRHAALNQFEGRKIAKELEQRDIIIKGGSWKGIAEETYQAYKDVDEVVRVSHEAGLGKLVAKVVPVAVMKG